MATDKGKGTGPNNFAQRLLRTDAKGVHGGAILRILPTLLYGSLAVLDESAMDAGLKASTRRCWSRTG